MRLAGVSARAAVRMSFSRRMGLVPSITSQDRWLQLVMTDSPIRMRSLGFSSTLSAMTSSQGIALKRNGACVVQTPSVGVEGSELGGPDLAARHRRITGTI